LSRISLIIFVYIVLYYTFQGLNTNAIEGDSHNYHIPIARAYLNNTITNPQQINGDKFFRYSPGSSEAILASIIFFKLPINIYNVFAIIALFLVAFYLARRFDLEQDLSLIFATSIASLHVIVRWLNTQIIDIWLLAFFLLSIYLLESPNRKIRYFLFLGFSLGMLFGSKFTGPIFFLILCIFYFRKLLHYVNLKNLIAFLIPFTICGLSWYIRNYLVTGDPIYPQSFLFFKGGNFPILTLNVWKATLLYSGGIYNFINAFLSEYTIWFVAIFFPLLFLFKKIRKNKYFDILLKLSLIGLLNFIVFFFLPSNDINYIMVSVLRYTYPALVPLILCIFILFKAYKKEELISVIALINILIIPEISYHPKILIFFIPIALIIYFYEKQRVLNLLTIIKRGVKNYKDTRNKVV